MLDFEDRNDITIATSWNILCPEGSYFIQALSTSNFLEELIAVPIPQGKKEEMINALLIGTVSTWYINDILRG